MDGKQSRGVLTIHRVAKSYLARFGLYFKIHPCSLDSDAYKNR